MYNNGKDIEPGDITYDTRDGVCFAFLAIRSIQADKEMKFYQGVGNSEKEARHNLIDGLVEHLNKIR